MSEMGSSIRTFDGRLLPICMVPRPNDFQPLSFSWYPEIFCEHLLGLLGQEIGHHQAIIRMKKHTHFHGPNGGCCDQLWNAR
jgi:hypothetical protein